MLDKNNNLLHRFIKWRKGKYSMKIYFMVGEQKKHITDSPKDSQNLYQLIFLHFFVIMSPDKSLSLLRSSFRHQSTYYS